MREIRLSGSEGGGADWLSLVRLKAHMIREVKVLSR
jgi:hypothetical protein